MEQLVQPTGFSSETKLWTAHGVSSLSDCLQQPLDVLLFGPVGGVWGPARVQPAGVGKLFAVDLGRGTATMTVTCTADQLWPVLERAAADRTQHRLVPTSALTRGQRLLTIRPRSRLTKLRPSPFGIAAGIVFGDGHAPAGRSTSEVTLYGAKRELAVYFQGCQQSEGKAQDLATITVHSLPRSFKARPDFEEAASFLYGWLAGYFATDGSVSKTGGLSISSADLDDLRTAQTVAARLGIGVGGIGRHDRVGIHQSEPTAMYKLYLTPSTIGSEFLIRAAHRARLKTTHGPSPSWAVRRVRPLDESGLVYQVSTEDGYKAVLDGFIPIG